jgi:hypothetical protein
VVAIATKKLGIRPYFYQKAGIRKILDKKAKKTFTLRHIVV